MALPDASSLFFFFRWRASRALRSCPTPWRADIVIIPAGVPRKPGMTRDDLFNINAGVMKTLVEAVAVHAPKVRTYIQ